MSNVGMELKGMDELLRKTEELGRKGSRIENKALREAGNLMAKEMRKEAPKRTGELIESIEVSNVKTSKNIKRIEVGPKVYWARFVNNGTSKMKSNPFMDRTYESNKKKAQDIIRVELIKGLGLK